MSDFELNIGKNNKIASKDIKAGVKKEDIKDNKLLSIFNAYDNGNEILEENEINRLKQDLQNAAAEDGDETELSKREARHLIKNLGININTKDLISFINKLVESSVNIKSCITDNENITTTKEENGFEVKDVYDLNGNLVRRESSGKYQGLDGILVKNTDGTVIFKIIHQSRLFGNTTDEYYFNNEENYNKERPSKIIRNKGNKNTGTTEEYTYHSNGKKASVVIKYGNEINSEQFFNEKGQITEEKNYQNGKLNERITTSYQGDKVAQKKTYNDKNVLTKEDNYMNGIIAETVEYPQKDDTWSEYEKIVTKYDNNGNKQSKDFIADNGKVMRHAEYDSNGNIKYDVEYYPNGNKKCETTKNGDDDQTIDYDENGKITNISSSLPDGYIGDFCQSTKTGDCYLLASIIAIKNTANGHEIISNLITKNSDGGYTVELPGAKKAAQGLMKDPRIDKNKMYITGKYTFSASEIKQIAEREDLANGEIDVRLIEAAFEKYRQEVKKTKDANGLGTFDGADEAGLVTGRNPFKILGGGTTEDAMYILTGEQSEVYYNWEAPNVSQDELSKYDYELSKHDSIKTLSHKVTKGQEKSTKAELNAMLDKIMNDINDGHIDYAVTCGFSMGNMEGHGLAIKSVTKDLVVMINPWNTSQTLTMSRKDFMKKVRSVSIAKIPYTHPPKPIQKPDFPVQEQPSQEPSDELIPINPQPGKPERLTPVKPQPNDDELTPINPQPGKPERLTPVKPQSNDDELTPINPQPIGKDSKPRSDKKLNPVKDEAKILDKADGNSLNRARNSKIDYNSYRNDGELTRIITGQEFKDFTKADFRKLINDYLKGNESTKRTIEKLVHNKSNWECAKEQDSDILAGLMLIYDNYDKYKNKK